ncbi:HNH endonuclease [Paraburkholderia sp. GAS334]|uniref:HNH endonuclease n=1 Tax=Paraburkholderia sp. GAS334 TaxID=3035131 RepID=UPI003D1A7EE3
MKITSEQIKAAYEVAINVYEGKQLRADGVQRLHQDHDIDPGSAGDFIDDLRLMLMGEEFHRTLSIEATDYFLGRIAIERDSADLGKAIAANYAHLDYYAKLPTGGPQQTKRRVVDAWAAKRAAPKDLGEVHARFERAVEQARADSPTVRQARLRKAPKVPKRITVISEAYVRNPDVVAEVLERAKGVCEQCAKPAPFIRRSDHTPFLEVHHRVRLADGGSDSIENAIALCPNCHRELHFGMEK